MINKDEILRALSLWFRPGDVFEVRVLDASTGEYLRPHIESGYFDYEHIPQVPEALARLRSYRGVYVTINPVNPALLARAVNRIRPVNREPTTSDADIIERRWILFDCDAIRPSGISSSDEEHSHALAKAAEIRDGLASLGWPDPVMTDSGNGAQLMYRTELPVDDAGLVQRIIADVAAASDAHVDIDRTVYNPARIWRLPGTQNCKGDHTPVRPHRMARILAESAPENLVSAALISDTLTRTSDGEAPPEAPRTGEPDISGIAGAGTAPEVAFELDTWIRHYCPELGMPSAWQGGRKWLFPVCPFNDAHTDKSAVLLEQPSGAVVFRCHHNSCSGKDWFALRELREPGYRTCEIILPKPRESVIVKPLRNELILPPEPVILPPWQTVTNDDIHAILKGTYLGEITDLFGSVTTPPLPLEAALLKSIVIVACALSEPVAGWNGRESRQDKPGNLAGMLDIGSDLARLRINTAGGQVCNIYSMLVANSASGKDIGNLLDKLAVLFRWDLGTAGSAEGIAEALAERPNGLLVISELANWLDPHHWQHKAAGFLTEAFSKGYYKQNFSSRGGKNGMRQSPFCYPNISANIQPDVFAAIVNSIDVSTGFLGRFLYCKMPETFCDPRHIDLAVILQDLYSLIDVFRRKAGIVEVPDGYLRHLSEMFKEQSPEILHPNWRRLVNEYGPRFAVMLSINHQAKTQGERVILTDDCWLGAEKLILWFFAHAERMLIGVEEIDQREKSFENLLRKIFGKLRKLDKGSGVSIAEISRSGIRGTTSKTRQEALLELMERGLVGRLEDGIHFKIVNTPPEWQ